MTSRGRRLPAQGDSKDIGVAVKVCLRPRYSVLHFFSGDSMSNGNAAERYWRANLRLVAGCLVVWFIVSLGFGVILVEQLNRIRFFGFELGFWFAQQGSILVFIALIFFYAWRMNRLDREHGMDEE